MINPETTIHLRRFRVELRSKETGEKALVYVTLDKAQLQAAQAIGQSSNEIIERYAARDGYEVLDVFGKADKLTVTIDLNELWQSGVRRGEA